MTPDPLTVRFLRAVYGGDCMARLEDGRALFVPFVLPGERACVELTETKRGFARGRVLELLEASSQRVSPRCAHFGVCGGCHTQHLAPAYHPALRQNILNDQLTRLGGFADPPILPTLAAGEPWNYRNALQFHLGAEGKPGFQRQDGAGVIPVSECWLPMPDLADLWPRLGFEAGSAGRVSLRLGSDGGALLALEGGELPELTVEESGLSVVSLGADDSLVVMAGESFTLHQVRERWFRVGAGSFFQVNPAGTELLVETALAALDPRSGETILDLYCGVGLFSAFLAEAGCKVIGVESSVSACADFAANLDEFDKVSLYEGAVEVILPRLDARVDKVILDPPRAGLAPQALDALAALNASRIVYVSCDPSTLARDLRRLAGKGWRLVSAQPLDLFPQTYHVETVVLMSRVDK